MLLGKPLFPGRNVVHQLELITDLLGTPSAEVINKVQSLASHLEVPALLGRNVVHQLQLITDLLGTNSAEVINKSHFLYYKQKGCFLLASRCFPAAMLCTSWS